MKFINDTTDLLILKNAVLRQCLQPDRAFSIIADDDPHQRPNRRQIDILVNLMRLPAQRNTDRPCIVRRPFANRECERLDGSVVILVIGGDGQCDCLACR